MTQIYQNIDADIQKNSQKNRGDNSVNSELADYYVFLHKSKKNIKDGDIIEYENIFWEKITLKVISKDFIDYQEFEPFIEILCKLL